MTVAEQTAARETIFAVASGSGRAAVCVLRLSGPGAFAAVAALGARPAPPRVAALRWLRGDAGEVLDRALVIRFPAPASYTGEDCAELHLHGGLAVRQAVAAALLRLGLRPAEPGEFTRRAVLHGRMDLLEAEAVADLVDAETSEQRRQALRQMEGALGTLYRDWSARLRLLLAEQEALIDFVDEDLPEGIEPALADAIAALRGEIARHLDDGRRGERLREGLVFAIVGPPNAGKSSLLNALAGRDAAIVSPAPGTTRDAVEVRLELGGVPVTLVDTAGLRDTEDAVEAEGIRRTRLRAAAADLVVSLAGPEDGWAESAAGLRVASKADLRCGPPEAGLPVSVVTGEGLDRLRTELAGAAASLTARSGPPPLTRARHRACLEEAVAVLAEAGRTERGELRGEALRLAMAALGRITGEVDVEDVLETIFSRFCIGK